MKVRSLLALLPAVWICLPANLIHAQQNPLTTVKTAATGRISTVLKDPSGAVVTGAKIEIRSIVPGFKRSQESDQQGHFVFSQVPVGRYQVTIPPAALISQSFLILPLPPALRKPPMWP